MGRPAGLGGISGSSADVGCGNVLLVDLVVLLRLAVGVGVLSGSGVLASIASAGFRLIGHTTPLSVAVATSEASPASAAVAVSPSMGGVLRPSSKIPWRPEVLYDSGSDVSSSSWSWSRQESERPYAYERQ